MALGGETFIVGQYTVMWNSTALGIMQGEQGQPTLEYQPKGKPIQSSDAWGQTTIDVIYLGADVFMSFTCMEYEAGTQAAWWPWGSLGILGVIGRLYFDDLAQTLLLTDVTGTPAETFPATFTANKAILAEGFNTQLLFGPDLRVLPIRQRLLPYDTDSMGAYGFWVTA
jgi:hypothetical protein